MPPTMLWFEKENNRREENKVANKLLFLSKVYPDWKTGPLFTLFQSQVDKSD